MVGSGGMSHPKCGSVHHMLCIRHALLGSREIDEIRARRN
jgi:hypothetical protein